MTEPGSPAPIRILIADDQELVRAGRAGYLQRAMAAGASGFLDKDASAEQLAAE